jgi:hypothetical protein
MIAPFRLSGYGAIASVPHSDNAGHPAASSLACLRILDLLGDPPSKGAVFGREYLLASRHFLPARPLGTMFAAVFAAM